MAMTSTHTRLALLLTAVIGGLASVRAAPQRSGVPALPQVLAAAGNYVAAYEKAFGAVLSEEVYRQTDNYLAGAKNRLGRVTTSDMLMFSTGGSGWMVFRDVLDVDGKPVDGERGRLLALAAEPSREALADAMRRTAESARQNLGIIARTITVPMSGLTYLRRENQARSTFEFDGMKSVAKLDVVLVRFAVTDDQPATDDATATTGRVWIEPVSGRVVRSEITHASRSCTARIDVQYAAQPGIGVWVPVRMYEQYDVEMPAQAVQPRGGQAVSAHVDGLATYRNFRQFEVKAGLTIR
jgi:hypothetical protein